MRRTDGYDDAVAAITRQSRAAHTRIIHTYIIIV